MVIQVVNFNLEGITHEQYVGAATELAPPFMELNVLKSKVCVKIHHLYQNP